MLAACGMSRDREPEIAVGEAWVREVAPGRTAAAVYLTITNRGSGDDRLLGADSPAAARARLHSSSKSGAVARMRPLANGLEVPAGSVVELKPGGTHVMLEGLKQPLRAGETVDVAFTFARSGRRPIIIRVVPIAAPDNHSRHGT